MGPIPVVAVQWDALARYLAITEVELTLQGEGGSGITVLYFK